MGRAARAVLTLLCLLPPPGATAEGPRSLALVEFAVRAPAGQAEGAAWLGPALSELLQAKLQLFGGARVLERQRVRALLRDAKADAAGADDAQTLSALIPADVLVAGSVSVAPEDSRRIRVQARAFEVQTAKIVSEAAFSGTGDLAGLLKIAEDLARTLAEGLGLSYTPEQLAYAEPARLDALRLFVEGEEHFHAGRHREAISALQGALEGNEGRYYAAAHRLQGEAYQALAKASAGEEERKVREEYLKKFREDALAASGALYDLGLAYEANGLWKEAAETYRDYLDALGGAGDIVTWRLDLAVHLLGARAAARASHVGQATPQVSAHGYLPGPEGFLVALATMGTGRFNLSRGIWETLTEHPVLLKVDGRNGRPASEVRLDEALGFVWKPESRFKVRLLGLSGDRAVVAWDNAETPQRGVWQYRNVWAALLDLSGRVLWKWELGVPNREIRHAYCVEERVYLYLKHDLTEKRDTFLVTLDLESGRELSRLTFAPGQADSGTPNLTGLDLAAATLTDGGRETDLVTGAGRDLGEKPPGAPYHPLPTGIAGLRYVVKDGGVAFYRGGLEVAFFEGWRLHPPGSGEPRPVHSGPLLLFPLRPPQRGFLVVDPESWKAEHLFSDIPDGPGPGVLAQDGRHILFSLQVPANPTEAPGPYGAPKGGGWYTLLLYDVAAGTLRTREAPISTAGRMAFIGDADLIDLDKNVVQRVALAPRGAVQGARPAEAHLRLAACLTSTGDLARAGEEVGRFEHDFPGDVRGVLARMRIARARAADREAADLAVKALSLGRLEAGEVEECAAALRRVHPELRAAIGTPIRGRLLFRALTEQRRLVCTWTEPAAGGLPHLLVDLASGTSRVVAVEGVRNAGGGALRYAGRLLAGLLWTGSPGKESVLVVDLESGERRVEERSPLPEDAADLLATHAEAKALQMGGGLAVRADPVGFRDAGGTAVTVSDIATRAQLARVEVTLSGETVADACADRDGLVVTVSGGSYPAYRDGGRGTWFRVEHYPLGPGARRWSYEAEGWIGANPVFEGDRVVIAAYEGRVPQVTVAGGTGPRDPYRLDREPLALARIALDRLTGKKVAEAALKGSPGWHTLPTGRDSPWYGRKVTPKPTSESLVVTAGGFDGLHDLFIPWPRRCLFPGWEHSIHRYPDGACGSWWLYAPDRPPVLVEAEPHGSGYRIVRTEVPVSWGSPIEVRFLVAGDLVYESTAGGVILVKDFAAGRGLDSIAWGRLAPQP